MRHSDGEQFPSVPSNRTSRDDLLVVIAEAFRVQSVGAADVHQKVCAFVRARRDAGDPPERVIVALKDVIDRAAVRGHRTERQSALVETIIRWCINEYYQRADAYAPNEPDEHP